MKTGNLCVLNLFATLVSPDRMKRRLFCAWAEQCGEAAAIQALIIPLPHPGHDQQGDAGTDNDLWGTTCFLEIAGYFSAFALCPNICFLLLGLGLWRERGWRKRNFRVAPGASQSCLSNVQGSRASFSLCWAKKERQKGGRIQQRMCPSCGRYWEHVAEEEEVKFDWENALSFCLSLHWEVCTSSCAGRHLPKHPSLPGKAKGVCFVQ